MLNLIALLASELALKSSQIKAALDLFAEGGTVPFIARYRKEQTEEMDEIQLRTLSERFAYLTELQDRKKVILESIESQGKLTDELKRKIEASLLKTEIEDSIYPISPNVGPEQRSPVKKDWVHWPNGLKHSTNPMSQQSICLKKHRSILILKKV